MRNEKETEGELSMIKINLISKKHSNLNSDRSQLSHRESSFDMASQTFSNTLRDEQENGSLDSKQSSMSDGIPTRSQSAFRLSALATIFLATFLTVGCNNKGSDGGGGGGAPPPGAVPFNGQPGMIANCANCPTQPITLLSAVTVSNVSRSFQLRLTNVVGNFAGVSANPRYLNPDDALITYYRGPLAATGTLTISGADPYLCNLPPGQYTVTTVSAGLFTGTQVGSWVLGIQGGAGAGRQLQLTGMFVTGAGRLVPSNPAVSLSGSMQVSGCPMSTGVM